MRTFLLIASFSGLSVFLFGDNPDSVAAAKQYEVFKELSGKEQYKEASQALDQAIASYQKAQLLDKWLYMQATKGRFMAEEYNQPFEALDYLDRCLAEQLWRAPQNHSEHIELCYFYLEQFYIAKQFAEDFVRAKKALEKAYDIFHKGLKGDEDSIAEYMFFQFGNTYIRLGEFGSAKPVFEEGLKYSFDHQAPGVAKYCDHGGFYVALPTPDYPQAKKLFLEGVAREGVSEEDLIFTKIGLIECLAQMNDLGEALKATKELEEALKKPFKTDRAAKKLPEFRYNLQENYGLIYSKKGDRARALYWYREALKTAQRYPKSTKRQCAFYQICISDLLMESGKAQEALSGYHGALQTILAKFDAPVGVNPSRGNLKAENVILRALYGKARAFRALGQLEKALECYELIPFVEAKLRATHDYESSSLLALKESRPRFQEAVDIAWQLFEQSNGNPEFAERAFQLTERARGMLLLQSLVQARQLLPNELLDKDYQLRARMAWLDQEIAAEKKKGAKADTEKIKGWDRQIFDLKLERQKLLADYPAYKEPDSVLLQVLAAKDVRSLLRPGQAMVDYFLTGTAAYVFSFDANGDFRWRKAALPAQFAKQAKQFAARLWVSKNHGKEQFLRQAWLLDSLLLAPERLHWGKAANSLLIVPDDVLTLLPFEVFLSQSPRGGTWSGQPWLLLDYNFSYAYSATLLALQKAISEEHAKATEKPRYLFGGFAPSYADSGVYKLKNTRPMVKNVRKMLGGKEWLDTKAKEERFKNSAADYQILLLAMHGILDNEHPELSHLLFGDPGPNSLMNNNKLSASELQIMRLRADLVVLSACHSGAGKHEQGEGVYSLARAFAAAGVPATVMSLWPLDENTAPPLVEAFFKYLQQGKTKDEALRQAKIDFLKDGDHFDTTHPFFWAGLSAAGDMKALDLPAAAPQAWQGWWILCAAALAAISLWWWRRKRSE